MRKIEKAIAAVRGLARRQGHRLRPFRRFGAADASLATSCLRCPAEAEVYAAGHEPLVWKFAGSALGRKCPARPESAR